MSTQPVTRAAANSTIARKFTIPVSPARFQRSGIKVLLGTNSFPRSIRFKGFLKPSNSASHRFNGAATLAESWPQGVQKKLEENSAYASGSVSGRDREGADMPLLTADWRLIPAWQLADRHRARR